VITAASLRSRDPLALLCDLGYSPARLAVDPKAFRAAGIEIGWGDHLPLALVLRLPRLDVYLADAAVDDAQARCFLRSLAAYNAVTKPVLLASDGQTLAVYDLSLHRELRRLDVDYDSPSPHAVDRLNLIAAGPPVGGVLSDPPKLFDRALDRESLTRQFFERFRGNVIAVARTLREQLDGETQEAVDGQALLLLSRLLFLYFIQQKGWLAGERRFLVDRLDAALRAGSEFFSSVLTPLFFGCLNTPAGSRDAAAQALGEIPYLNGGLFEPSSLERRHPSLRLPNELLRSVIDDGFEKFSFSIDERDAAGTHVDPEMLGKVFESLMADDERLASGSFYTPRALVDVLTTRAVEEWLGWRGEAASHIDGPTAAAMLRRLETITILDPACGSGAFLLSTLGVVERLTRALAQRAGEAVPRDLRQRIVERSLYGVDLKPEAVRLCELRLWLAIVAAHEAAGGEVPPLPNLDRNILQGNSLLGPTDFLGTARGDVYRDWIHALRTQQDLVTRYRSAAAADRPALSRMIRAHDRALAGELLARAIDVDETELERLTTPQRDLFGRALPLDSAGCAALQARIREHRRLLARVDAEELDFFAFDIHFAAVVARGGFDVVAGNPPWVRSARIDPTTRRMLSERYRLFRGERGDAAFHQPDLSVAFFERAVAMAAEGGVVALLMPAKVLNAGYAAPLRRMAQSLDVVALDDWSDDARRHFDADTFPLGVTIRKCPPQEVVEVRAGGRSFRVCQRRLPLLGGEWALVPPDIGAIAARLQRRHPAMAEALGRVPLMGVKTGANAAFFLDVVRETRLTLVTADGLRIPRDAACRCVRGRDVRRWRAGEGAWMLWPPRGGWTAAPPRWLRRYADAREVLVEELRLQYVRPEHASVKVVWKDLSRGLCAAVAAPAAIPNQTLYLLDAVSYEEAEVLTALLHSTIVNALTIAVAERAKDAHYRYFARTMARIPLPRLTADDEEWSRLARCTRRAATEDCDGDISDEVDDIAAALYGVTPSEERTLRRFVAERLGRAD
jgi:hypothetical protein